MSPDIEYPNIKIWDNRIDDEFIFEKDKESDYYSWQYNNMANTNSFPNNRKGTHLFWSVTTFPNKKIFDQYTSLAQFISTHLIKKDFQINSVFINGQFIGQDGTSHQDMKEGLTGQKTLMVYLNNRWQKEWGGEFQVLKEKSNDSEVIHSIEYKPGRIIYFDSSLHHRGLAPKIAGVFRKSLVYRIQV
jgi:Rps23 Pro-64 3,4-dihydroxylase Tpa1-like proline 4-hydroxylase|tara:strand:- start:1410 stop:1973 length:564 start_codon:yes stop_codon:yes gene_type:complete